MKGAGVIRQSWSLAGSDYATVTIELESPSGLSQSTLLLVGRLTQVIEQWQKEQAERTEVGSMDDPDAPWAPQRG